jgi:hypothetical protein
VIEDLLAILLKTASKSRMADKSSIADKSSVDPRDSEINPPSPLAHPQ